jgi:hypothetical protein
MMFEKKKLIVHYNFEHAKQVLKHHQFVPSFERWNFINNGTSFFKWTIQFIMLPLWVFKNIKL